MRPTDANVVDITGVNINAVDHKCGRIPLRSWGNFPFPRTKKNALRFWRICLAAASIKDLCRWALYSFILVDRDEIFSSFIHFD